MSRILVAMSLIVAMVANSCYGFTISFKNDDGDLILAGCF